MLTGTISKRGGDAAANEGVAFCRTNSRSSNVTKSDGFKMPIAAPVVQRANSYARQNLEQKCAWLFVCGMMQVTSAVPVVESAVM